MGTNPKDSDDMGAELEFWLGEGEETEQIRISTSTLVFIPNDCYICPYFVRRLENWCYK
jgi:hypothetical protein